jgi:hypothetical protein
LQTSELPGKCSAAATEVYSFTITSHPLSILRGSTACARLYQTPFEPARQAHPFSRVHSLLILCTERAKQWIKAHTNDGLQFKTLLRPCEVYFVNMDALISTLVSFPPAQSLGDSEYHQQLEEYLTKIGKIAPKDLTKSVGKDDDILNVCYHAVARTTVPLTWKASEPRDPKLSLHQNPTGSHRAV